MRVRKAIGFVSYECCYTVHSSHNGSSRWVKGLIASVVSPVWVSGVQNWHEPTDLLSFFVPFVNKKGHVFISFGKFRISF